MTKIRLIVPVTIVAFALVGVFAGLSRVHALDWNNRASYHGYFTNLYSNGYQGVLPNNIDGRQNDAIPSSVDTAQKYYDFIHTEWNEANDPAYQTDAYTREWMKTGVAFTVNALLGNDGDHAHRALTATDWSQLQTRISQPGIRFVANQILNESAFGAMDGLYSGDTDDTFWWYNPNHTDIALLMYDGSTMVWAQFYSCANTVGSPPGLPGAVPQKSWAANTTVSTPSATVNAGDTITWNYGVTQKGPDATDRQVTYGDRGIDGGGNPTDTMIAGTWPTGTASGATKTYSSTYVTQPSDVGKQICRESYAVPGSSDGGMAVSNVSCVTVNPVYELHPLVTFDGNGVTHSATPGETVAFHQSVINKGPTASTSVATTTTRCYYAPGAGAPVNAAEKDSPLTAAQLYGAGGICTASPTGGQGSTMFAVGTRTYPDVNEDTASLPAGSRVCYILSVKPPSGTVPNDTWRHSPVACLEVLKTLAVSVTGADLRAGSVQTASASNINGTFYGSWAQYGIFGINGIGGMGSASAYAGGAGSADGARTNALTFANTPSLGSFYAQTPTDNYYAAYGAKANTTTGSLTYGGAVKNGTDQIIKVNGDLSINQDITYSGSYDSVADIPRLVFVVSGNVTVSPNVGRIDAWIITQGTLYTCSDFTAANAKLTVTTCPNQLTFNGPVVAANIKLGRTFGADGTPGNRAQSAEIFNLDPEYYLSTYAASGSTVDIQTVYEKELPPRW